jgi:hypothetical protein
MRMLVSTIPCDTRSVRNFSQCAMICLDDDRFSEGGHTTKNILSGLLKKIILWIQRKSIRKSDKN